jgi:hypothetical protein
MELFQLDRRTLIGTIVAGAALAASPAAARLARRIPQKTSARVIVDNDFAGDPDGLVALAHQLLSPKTIVPLVTVSALDAKFAGGAAPVSVTAGVRTAQELIDRLAPATRPKALGGRNGEYSKGQASDAAQAIVREAMRDDPLPLYLTCGGPLSNVADALRMEPAIAQRMTVIWIGGGGYPQGGWEYNLSVDIEAARHVIERTQVPLWQIPQPAYRLMLASVAEMETELPPISPFGAWLYDRFTSPPDFVDVAGSWPLGDSPLVLLTAISGESSHYREWPARHVEDNLAYGAEIARRTVRVYDDLDMRLTWSDFLAKLRLHAANR